MKRIHIGKILPMIPVKSGLSSGHHRDTSCAVRFPFLDRSLDHFPSAIMMGASAVNFDAIDANYTTALAIPCRADKKPERVPGSRNCWAFLQNALV